MAIGITFDETMLGAFALGTSEPEDGAEAGELAGTALVMNATVTIADLDAFIADPKHEGRLKGSIDFAPLGTGLRADDGVFNLFSPSKSAGLKYMVYEMAFRHQGKARYLAGKKHVRDDPGFDLWSDTTTLFTTLHDGTDATAPVIGAGVLRLDMGDFTGVAVAVGQFPVDDAHAPVNGAFDRHGDDLPGGVFRQLGHRRRAVCVVDSDHGNLVAGT